MESRKELAEQQYNFISNIRLNLGLNIVTCGNCGAVLLHKIDAEKIHCYECNQQMEQCDCPDLWYDSDINNYEEVISIEPTITFADIIQVAERVSLDVTIYEIKEVFNRYNQISENNEDNFSVIIEDLLYNIISERVV